MLGLSGLQLAHPETTLDKIAFLFHYAFTNFHPHTTVISFTALFALVLIRNFKNQFKKYWWIYRMPEVLLVVAISTGAHNPRVLSCISCSWTYSFSPVGQAPLGRRGRRYLGVCAYQHRIFFRPISNFVREPQAYTTHDFYGCVRFYLLALASTH